jgi:hypothetical protein
MKRSSGSNPTDPELQTLKRNLAFEDHKLLWFATAAPFFAACIAGASGFWKLASVLGCLAGVMLCASGVKAIRARRSAVREISIDVPGLDLTIDADAGSGLQDSPARRRHAYVTGAFVIAIGLCWIFICLQIFFHYSRPGY